MRLKPGQPAILIVNVCALIGFSAYYLSRWNYEFMIYLGAIIFFLAVIAATNHRVDYPNGVLWGLTAWALLHMCGGAFYIHGTRLYEVILIPLSRRYPILRYDQFVHVVGFGAATLVMFHVLKPLLRAGLDRWWALSIVVVMAGLGVGAFNEIVEFGVTIVVPQSGVGDYVNTGLDLVSDLIGAIGAMAWMRLRARQGRVSQEE